MDSFGLTNPERAELARLKSQVADLARQLAAMGRSNPGVSTANSAPVVRTTQLGFAAELTGAWDAATGYPWKRKRLEGVALTDPDVQPTGTGAVTPDGDTGLTAGAEGWMEPSPDGVGYLFVAGGSGGTSLTLSGALCGRLYGLTEDECLAYAVASASGLCAGVATGQSGMLAWSGVDAAWVSADDVVTPAVTGPLEVTIPAAPGVPAATVGGVALYYNGCVNGVLEFVGAGAALCDDGDEETVETAADPCGDNTFRVQVSCRACTYPFDCCEGEVPAKLYLTLEWVTGGHPTMTYEMTHTEDIGTGSPGWLGLIPNNYGDISGTWPVFLTEACQFAIKVGSVTGPSSCIASTLTGGDITSCDPFLLEFTGALFSPSNSCPGTGGVARTVNITISDEAP
jgi:hypothetical protein